MQNKLMKFTSFIILVFLIEPSQQDVIAAIESAFHAPPQFRNQLLDDMFMLKDNLNQLQGDLDSLSKRLNSQTDVIRHIKLQISLSETAIDKCEMEAYFHDMDSKLLKIKQKIQQVVNDNHDQQLDDLDAIMHNARKSFFDCSMDGRELFVTFQMNITSKLEEFDRQMERLNALEQRLINTELKETRTTDANEALTKLLKEIQSKLYGHEEKLLKFETFLPLMVNATQSMAVFKEKENALCTKQNCISKKILELTKGQVDGKP